jgi:dCMP deaminase
MGKWSQRFVRLAQEVGSWSKDPSTKVGCVLVDRNRRVIATGYNGLPRRIEDSVDRLDDRPTKYAMTVHAEANALLQAGPRADGCTAYVTHTPCSHCAAMLIQAGVYMVVAVEPWDNCPDAMLVKRMFVEAEIEVRLP